ncbi:MAG TPA: c-type cytochrome [Terracidiphilus sp.]|nr:c-type cytochrome [Terracidiphilus sp.]
MKRIALAAMILMMGSALVLASDGGWMRKVPDADRKRVNPYAGSAQAAEAGKHLFDENCAKCHGADALGRHGRPSLRSERISHATDGELAWILKNGSAWKGMPSWSSLPEPERWQIIAYLRSLQAETQPNNPSGDKR